MNNLRQFATLNLATLPGHQHTKVLLDACAQSFVIVDAAALERTSGILDSLRKTWRVRLGVEGEIAPGTRVRLTGGPHAFREGFVVCLPVFGGKVVNQYYVRLVEEGGLSGPVSAPPSWLAALPPQPETRTKGAPRDLRAWSSDARYGRRPPVFGPLDEALVAALDTLFPGDVIVLGAEEYRGHVAELIAARGRTDLHVAVAPHSYLAKALITDGTSLGSTGVFLGYADSRGTAVINVENSCTQTLPAGSYYLLNDFALANCPEDELLANLTDSPAYEYKFDSCGHCHAQGFHLNTHHWPCPLCGSGNPGELHSRIAVGERIDFGPTMQQLAAAYETIERHRDLVVPGLKVIRITEVRDLRDAPVGKRKYIGAGMFAVGAEELPDECPASVSQTATLYAEGIGVQGTGLLIKPSHTREGAFNGLLQTLGPKNVASIKAGEGILKTPSVVTPAFINERFEEEPYRRHGERVWLGGIDTTVREELKEILRPAEPRPVKLRPSPLPPPDGTRVTTISYLVEKDGRRLDPSARLIGVGGAARLEAGMYVIVPTDWPAECAVKVFDNFCGAVAPEGGSDRVFPVWPQDSSRAAADEYDRRRAAREAADAPKVTSFDGRRIFDISHSSGFNGALKSVLAEARDGDALAVYNETDREQASTELARAGVAVTVGIAPVAGAGSPITITRGLAAGRRGRMVGRTDRPRDFFAVAAGVGVVILNAHDFHASQDSDA